MPLYAPRPDTTADRVLLSTAATPRFIAIPRDAAQGSATLTAGSAFFTAFTAPGTGSISTLFISSRGTAAAGTTLARLGLFTVDSGGSLTLVARSASNTSLCNATFTNYSEALATAGGFPASYTLLTGTRYALGAVFVGSSTAPIVYGSVTLGTSAGWLPWLSMTITGQTDLATSYAIGALSSTGTVPFLAAF